jgi:hypothetical protein
MPYALSRKLRRDVRANCNEHFRPARENDIIVSRFSGIGDAERWLATFCNWGSQESLSGNRRLSCVLAAMTNNASTVFGNSPERIETWRNFLYLFREKYLGHKKPWSGALFCDLSSRLGSASCLRSLTNIAPPFTAVFDNSCITNALIFSGYGMLEDLRMCHIACLHSACLLAWRFLRYWMVPT